MLKSIRLEAKWPICLFVYGMAGLVLTSFPSYQLPGKIFFFFTEVCCRYYFFTTGASEEFENSTAFFNIKRLKCMHIDRETWSICGFLSWNTRLYAGRTLKGYFRHVSVGFSRMVDYNHIHHEIWSKSEWFQSGGEPPTTFFLQPDSKGDCDQAFVCVMVGVE